MAQIKLRETAAQVVVSSPDVPLSTRVAHCVLLYVVSQFSVVVDNFGDKYENATRIVATYYQLMRFCSAPNKVIKDVLEKFSM